MRSWILMVALLGFSSLSFADAPEMQAVQEPVVGHGSGGATGFCSVLYYNYCSQWIWTQRGLSTNDEVGVVFDLPNDCGKAPGEECVNTHFWWYWRNTVPVWGYTVVYRLYELDENRCPVQLIDEITGRDPVERWNYYAGFSATIYSDLVGIVASWETAVYPYTATDNAYRNQQANCGSVPTVARSFYFGNPHATRYCPPVPFEDPVGYINLLMDAGFDCLSTSTQPASWGAVKGLFR